MKISRIMAILTVCASFALITACTSSLKVTRLHDAPLEEGRAHSEVRFIKAGENAPASYKILGKVYAYKRGGTVFSKPSDESLMKMMREPAAQMGADAVIDFRSSIFNGSDYNTIRRWASGLAVKTGTAATPAEERQSDLIVAIAPPLFAKQQSAKNEAKFTKAIIDAAQYYLEQKGYYALIVASQPLGKREVDAMSAATLADYGDSRAGLILLLSLDEVSSVDGIIAGGGGATLSAKLVAKKDRQVVWENTAGGSTFALGALNTMFQDRKKEAIYSSVKHVFETLAQRAEDYPRIVAGNAE